jgi:hypothetical protein
VYIKNGKKMVFWHSKREHFLKWIWLDDNKILT